MFIQAMRYTRQLGLHPVFCWDLRLITIILFEGTRTEYNYCAYTKYYSVKCLVKEVN